MRRFLLVLIIAVLASLSSGTAAQASPVVLDMESLPNVADPDWQLVNYSGQVSAAEGTLEMNVTGAGSCSYYLWGPKGLWHQTVDNDRGWVVETRLRIDPASTGCAKIWINDHTNTTILLFYRDQIQVIYPDFQTYSCDTTDFRTYRISGQGSSFKVFADGLLIIDYVRTQPGNGTQVLGFAAGSNTRAYWDYFLYDTYNDSSADCVPPTTSVELAGLTDDGSWYRSEVQVTLTAVDNPGGTGIKSTEYSFDGTSWIDYTAPFIVAEEGTACLCYRSCDQSGNLEPTRTRELNIDRTPPSICVASPSVGQYLTSDLITIDYTVVDELAGLKTASAFLDGNEVNCGQTLSLAARAGNHTLTVTAVDRAGNQATASVSFEVLIDGTARILSPIP